MEFTVVALSPAIADSIRIGRRSPFGGHPVHAEVAGGHGPCRQCLKTFAVGTDRRLLFTLDPFDGLEPFPLPGPAFIHESPCEVHPTDGGFPEDLRGYPLTLNAYGRGRALRAQVRVDDGRYEAAVEDLLARADVDYIHVRDTKAGCYDFRLERAASGSVG